ncbi:MAG: hypothetical protein WBB07_15680 [Mycobacterium sp.]
MKAISKNLKTDSKRVAGCTLFGGALLFTAGLGVAGAEPVAAPDGAVDIAVGDTTILSNVPADVAASTTAALCGTAATDVSVLVDEVDTQSVNRTVCTGLPGGDLVLTQNVSNATTSPVVPGTESGTSAEGTSGAGAAEAPTGSSEGSGSTASGAGAAEQPTTEGAHGAN